MELTRIFSWENSLISSEIRVNNTAWGFPAPYYLSCCVELPSFNVDFATPAVQ